MALFAGRRVSDFPVRQAAPDAVMDAPDLVAPERTAMRFTVLDSQSDRLWGGPPRAQLASPSVWTPGDSLYARSAFYLPDAESFPDTGIDWLSIYQGPYGPPFDGSPPVSLKVGDGTTLTWQRNASHGWDVPLSLHVSRGRWHTYAWRVYFARADNGGYAELWLDGRRVTFFSPGESGSNPSGHAPTTRLHTATRDASNSGGACASYLQLYFAPDTVTHATVYHRPLLIGRTPASVGLGGW